MSYTVNQNNKAIDANRKAIAALTGQMTSETARAKGVEDGIRENISALIATTIDDALSPRSANPVENRVINAELEKKAASDTQLSAVAYTGSYNSLTDLPTIPPAPTVDSILSSESENAVGNKWVKEALDARADASALKAVATSGSYNDLSDLPPVDTTFYVGSSGKRLVVSIVEDVSSGVITRVQTESGYLAATDGTFYAKDQSCIVTLVNTTEAEGISPITGNKLKIAIESNGNIYCKYWNPSTSEEPVSYTLVAYGADWWDGYDFPVLATKTSDLFPTSGNMTAPVSSHGTKMFIGQREREASAMEQAGEESQQMVTSIRATIGTVPTA